MLIDIRLLKKNKNYRYFFIGQLISVLGANISFIAVPFLVYKLTQSTAKVGLIGVISLVPLVVFGFYGGAIADQFNRRKIIIFCESLLTLFCFIFAFLIFKNEVTEKIVFILVALMSSLSGLHRPALSAMSPRLVEKEDLQQLSALDGFRGTFSHVIGPAVGGVILSSGGPAWAFIIDAFTYLVSLFFLLQIKSPHQSTSTGQFPTLRHLKEGFEYALKRPVLLGTYLVDMVAMVFCYPMVLFPALASNPNELGPFYSAMSLGAFFATLTSAWTPKVKRHGMMIALAAFFWAVFIAGFSRVNHYFIGLLFLVFAGWSDMISAIFRSTIWNQTIPDSHRGRLAGIEMISYMCGPLIGNTLLGYLAAIANPKNALFIGSITSMVAIFIVVLFLLPFWRYESLGKSEENV